MGEHDVDTILHLIFSRLGLPHVFEGMCNPPGGDWSGISIHTDDRTKELRWLNLPRVTAVGAKRPDHVFQIFGLSLSPVVLAAESKERAAAVESSIGPRLKKYVSDLFLVSPSIERTCESSPWGHCVNGIPTTPKLASMVAFISMLVSDIDAVQQRADVDLICGFEFRPHTGSGLLRVRACTALGSAIAAFIRSLPLDRIGVEYQDV